MSLPEHHVRRLINSLSCKEPKDETMQEWGRAMSRYEDADCERVVEWVLKNYDGYGMPGVNQFYLAVRDLGIRRDGDGKPKLWERVPDTPECGRCHRHGLVRWCGEYFTVPVDEADGTRSLRRESRKISECPLDGMHGTKGSPLVAPPAKPDEGTPLRYEKLFACDCPAGTWRVEHTRLTDRDGNPVRLVQLRPRRKEVFA